MNGFRKSTTKTIQIKTTIASCTHNTHNAYGKYESYNNNNNNKSTTNCILNRNSTFFLTLFLLCFAISHKSVCVCVSFHFFFFILLLYFFSQTHWYLPFKLFFLDCFLLATNTYLMSAVSLCLSGTKSVWQHEVNIPDHQSNKPASKNKMKKETFSLNDLFCLIFGILNKSCQSTRN